MPDVLRYRAWDSAESVELNRLTEEFKKGQLDFPSSESGKNPTHELLRSIANVRHTAVHRICASARGLEQFLLDAEAFAVVLGDMKCVEKIGELRRYAVAIVEDLQRNQ